MEQENVENIVLAGDEVVIPLLLEQMPANLRDKIMVVLRLNINTPEHEVYRATMNAWRNSNSQKDAERVRGLLEKYREGGTAVVGLRDTIDALLNGKVSELMLTSSLREISVDQESLNHIPSISAAPKTLAKHLANPRSAAVVADMLVARTLSTGADITFIEDRNLLAEVGGVGAYLRYV
jgi:peptide subunit release factor 1 (eRF1)